MKCCICGKGPSQGIAIYRINRKGVAGIWACAKHLKQTDAPPIPDEIVYIVKALTQPKERP